MPAGLEPSPITPPVVTGTPEQGAMLSCSTGTWANTPTSYAYQWKNNYGAINGATAADYVLQPGDGWIYCTVTATNADGSGTANSNAVQIAGGVNPVWPWTAETLGQGFLSQRWLRRAGTLYGGGGTARQAANSPIAGGDDATAKIDVPSGYPRS